MIRTSAEALKTNAVAERLVGTVRRECLDWILIVNRRHLERVLRRFADHYNGRRPQRKLDLVAPDQAQVTQLKRALPTAAVNRRNRLGGLIQEYRDAASSDRLPDATTSSLASVISTASTLDPSPQRSAKAWRWSLRGFEDPSPERQARIPDPSRIYEAHTWRGAPARESHAFVISTGTGRSPWPTCRGNGANDGLPPYAPDLR